MSQALEDLNRTEAAFQQWNSQSYQPLPNNGPTHQLQEDFSQVSNTSYSTLGGYPFDENNYQNSQGQTVYPHATQNFHLSGSDLLNSQASTTHYNYDQQGAQSQAYQTSSDIQYGVKHSHSF